MIDATPDAQDSPKGTKGGFAPAIRRATLVATLLLGAAFLWRLAAFGIWDPWELDLADRSRRWLQDGEPLTQPPLASWLVAAGFELFGTREWSGRLPIALTGIATMVATYWLGRRAQNARVGWLAMLVIATTPLLSAGARQMSPIAPSLLAQALVALSGARLLAATTTRAVAWAGLLCAASALLSALSSGALLGPLPPLGALTALLLLQRDTALASQASRVAAGVLGVLFSSVALGTLSAVIQDAAEPSLWLGGAPSISSPPSFDRTLERAFHALTPWSGIGVLAIAALASQGSAPHQKQPASPFSMTEPSAATEAAIVRSVLPIWAALGLATMTLFDARYGTATFLAAPAVAVAVAIFFDDLQQERAASRPAAWIAALLTLLLLRDFSIYPALPLGGLALAGIELPSGLGRLQWAITLGAFTLTLLLALAIRPASDARLQLALPYRWLAQCWRRGLVWRLWLITGALIMASLLLAPLLVHLPGRPVPRILQRVALGLALLPPSLPLLVAAAQIAITLQARLGNLRLAPLVGASLGVGLYFSQFFVPAVSEHLSPRDVFATYAELGSGEELAKYNVDARSARYYLDREPKTLASSQALVEFLFEPERKWAILPADQLATIDQRFRQRQGKHLFVANARSTQTILVTNQALPSIEDQNPLSRHIVREPPEITNPVPVRFGALIELLGYDLEPIGGSELGAGQHFSITWYWRCISKSPRPYKVFVHIDGHGARIHGDHTPVQELYPTSLWEPGDVIVDRHELVVPAHFSAGSYTIYVGLYAGAERLPIVRGRSDGDNRANVGQMLVH